MSLMETMNIGEKSLQAHGARIKIHAKNIANLDTPNYVRKIPVLNATDDISFHGLLNSMKEDVFGVGTIPFQQGGVRLTGVSKTLLSVREFINPVTRMLTLTVTSEHQT